MTDEEMISNFIKDNKVTQCKTSYQDKTDSKKNKKRFNRYYKKEELKAETDYTVKKNGIVESRYKKTTISKKKKKKSK